MIPRFVVDIIEDLLKLLMFRAMHQSQFDAQRSELTFDKIYKKGFKLIHYHKIR